MNSPVYLETARLVLRNFNEADLNTLVDYRSHPLCAQYQRGQFKDRENLSRLIARTKTDDPFSIGQSRLAIARKDTEEIIGDLFVGISKNTAALGYTISYRYHRQGFAHELLSAFLPALQCRFPNYDIICCTDTENTASISLLLKLGFIKEGYRKEIDSLIFRLPK